MRAGPGGGEEAAPRGGPERQHGTARVLGVADRDGAVGGGPRTVQQQLDAAEAADADVAGEPADPVADALATAIRARGRQRNISFFAFTATPKGRTLEQFGRVNSVTGKHEAFHLYTMRQAIEEGFILDVLANYVTYQTYWNIERPSSTVSTIFSGTGRQQPDIEPLSTIIETLNARFGTSWTAADRVFFDVVADKVTSRPEIQQAAAVNTAENFKLVLAKAFVQQVVAQMSVAEDMALKFIDDEVMQNEVVAAYLPMIQGKAKVAWQEHCPIGELLGPDKESGHLEYKATMRTRRGSGEVYKPLETATLKPIAAFVNSYDGGTLLIGVADDGSAAGLELDYASLHKPAKGDRDVFQLHLINIVARWPGTPRN